MGENRATILIIDCVSSSINQLRDALVKDGFRVFLVHSGRETISIVRRRKINVAIIDVDIKDIEGYKIVPLIRDIKGDIKFIITTSENSVELEIKCREAGIVYYSFKPLNYSQIKYVIKSAIKTQK